MRSEKTSKYLPAMDETENKHSYLVIGFMFGTFIGILTKNIGVWAAIGMCLGIVFDVIAAEKQKNKD